MPLKKLLMSNVDLILCLKNIWFLSNLKTLLIKYRYCEGGELFHYIIEKKHLSEEVAAYIMK